MPRCSPYLKKCRTIAEVRVSGTFTGESMIATLGSVARGVTIIVVVGVAKCRVTIYDYCGQSVVGDIIVHSIREHTV